LIDNATQAAANPQLPRASRLSHEDHGTLAAVGALQRKTDHCRFTFTGQDLSPNLNPVSRGHSLLFVLAIVYLDHYVRGNNDFGC
jgi:hypothetical protein